jgi:hypothetical protein
MPALMAAQAECRAVEPLAQAEPDEAATPARSSAISMPSGLDAVNNQAQMTRKPLHRVTSQLSVRDASKKSGRQPLAQCNQSLATGVAFGLSQLQGLGLAPQILIHHVAGLEQRGMRRVVVPLKGPLIVG